MSNSYFLKQLCQERVKIQTFKDSHDILVPQFRWNAISIQRFVLFPNFVFTMLPPTILGQCQRAGMLCVR